MHTLMVIGSGLVLLAALLIAGWLFGRASLAAKVFIPVWLLATLANLYIGVTRAGNTVAQELPIQLLVLAVPAAVSIAFAWKLRPQ